MKNAARVPTQTDVKEQDKDDVGWRNFPQFVELLSSEAPAPLLAKVEKTCRQLNDIALSGSGPDQARAKAAMTAYGRSLDLLRTFTEMRDKQPEQK
jgi:hypothetical protein